MDLDQLPAVSPPAPWHQAQWGQLNQDFTDDRLVHALLLAGEPDTGVAAFALALARLLLCERPVSGLNCGECAACTHSAAGVHGDFLWVQPQEKSRAIKIDQVRDALAFVARTAGYGERKVVVFAPANAMNVNAFNALLKSLEEPADNTYLILACHALHAIPATIRSRCQLRRLATPSHAQSVEWLKPVLTTEERCSQYLSLAQGRPLLARRLFEEEGADAVVLRRAALENVTRQTLPSSEAATLWADVDTEPMLEEISHFVEATIRAMPADQLRGNAGRNGFALLDELGQLRRAVTAGSNPARNLLADALLAKCQTLLGTTRGGDTIAEK